MILYVPLFVDTMVSTIGPIEGPILRIYTHVNLKIGPLSVFRHHNIFVGKSYVWVRNFCCHPSLFLRYVNDNYRTIGPTQGPFFKLFFVSGKARPVLFCRTHPPSQGSQVGNNTTPPPTQHAQALANTARAVLAREQLELLASEYSLSSSCSLASTA